VPEGEYSVRFYETTTGDKPVLRWIKAELTVRQRRALGYALFRLLQRYGVGVCDTEFGRQLGGGLFEFRLRLTPSRDGEAAVLRVYCHATRGRVILLLGGHDKSRRPGRKHQDREIALARRRLREYLARRIETLDVSPDDGGYDV